MACGINFNMEDEVAHKLWAEYYYTIYTEIVSLAFPVGLNSYHIGFSLAETLIKGMNATVPSLLIPLNDCHIDWTAETP